MGVGTRTSRANKCMDMLFNNKKNIRYIRVEESLETWKYVKYSYLNTSKANLTPTLFIYPFIYKDKLFIVLRSQRSAFYIVL